jgi:hypothetical protein
MRHPLSVIIVTALLVVTAVEVVAHYDHAAPTPVTGISIALPSGMKSFPVELPQ